MLIPKDNVKHIIRVTLIQIFIINWLVAILISTKKLRSLTNINPK